MRFSAVFSGSVKSPAFGVGRAGIPPKYFCASAKPWAGGHVAGDRQHGVVRAVVVAVEGAHVVEAGAFEVLEAAVAVVVVFPLLEGVLADVDPHEAAVGLVLHVDADLFLDHVLLVLQRLGVEVERLHAVGFEPQHRLERRDRRGLDVVGEVGAGRAVVAAAAAGDHLVEHALRRVRRALEHQVLEQVREAGAVLRLQAHADVVDHRDADGRRAVVLGDDDGQAVVELLDVDRQRPCVAAGRCCRCRRGNRVRRQRQCHAQ